MIFWRTGAAAPRDKFAWPPTAGTGSPENFVKVVPMPPPESHQPSRACPICKKPADIGSDVFPFCSARCRLVDLNRWMEGRYAVSRPLDPQDIDGGPDALDAAPELRPGGNPAEDPPPAA
jgi:endogenous inhibitor of DNA gyrase (YacG/DUF329 family)